MASVTYKYTITTVQEFEEIEHIPVSSGINKNVDEYERELNERSSKKRRELAAGTDHLTKVALSYKKFEIRYT